MSGSEFEGRTAVVTGGVKGLGLAICRLLVERGAKVAVIDVDKDGLDAAVDSLSSQGESIGFVADLRRRENVEEAFASAVETYGGIDILINNAGIYPRRPILEIDDAAWDAMFDINLRSMFHMTAAAAKHMKLRHRGHIVSVASIDAYIPYAKNAHYAASKAGVISFTKSFAQELAPYNILVTGVSPSGINTPNLHTLGIYDDLVRDAPLGRLAEPDDVAEVVAFLAGPRNRYVTGETIVVSGGILMV